MSTPTVQSTQDRSTRLRHARDAVLAVFAANGAVFAAWASRIPDAKADLGLSASQLGVVLLGLSVGSILGLPVAGRITHRWGAAGGVRLGLLSAAVGTLVLAAGVDLLRSPVAVAAGLFLSGLGMGVWDVSMNLEGSVVERGLRRTIMPWFHAAFSGGTVVSALVGAGMSWAQVPVGVHVVAVMLVMVTVSLWGTRRFLPSHGLEDDAEPAGATTGRSAWSEPRTLAIGLMVLVAALTEGTANDWIAVAFVEGHHLPSWVGVVAFATFLGFMTAGRILGTGLLDRHGRVPVLRVLFVLALVGALLVVFGSSPVAFVGAALWGVGASMGFPVGMSAAADDPVRAPMRLSVVATIGYVAFLAGPPLLGFLGDHVGVLRSLLVVGAAVLLALLVVPAAREQDAAVAPPR